jgi:tetratricopeptide (TPR) repeat protein
LAGAAAAYREAIRLWPKLVEAHNNLGIVLKRQGDLAGAAAAHREAIRFDPGHVFAHTNLGGVLAELGDLPGAAAAHREAIRLAPKLPAARLNLGTVLRQQRDLAGAAAAFREAIRLFENYTEAHYALGIVLDEQGDPLGAATAFQKAVRLQPEHAEAQCLLGLALARQGRFQEGFAALDQGHRLGSQRPNWRLPSARWLKDMAARVSAEAKLETVAAGQALPADMAETLLMAEICLEFKGRPATAARLFAEAFDADPRLLTRLKAYRYNAACAAALAAAGKGTDAKDLPEAERTRLRRQARDWLVNELAVWRRTSVFPAVRPVSVATLTHWQKDPDLAGVRGPVALTKLPEAERRQWERLWGDVAAVLSPDASAIPPREAGQVPREVPSR